MSLWTKFANTPLPQKQAWFKCKSMKALRVQYVITMAELQKRKESIFACLRHHPHLPSHRTFNQQKRKTQEQLRKPALTAERPAGVS